MIVDSRKKLRISSHSKDKTRKDWTDAMIHQGSFFSLYTHFYSFFDNFSYEDSVFRSYQPTISPTVPQRPPPCHILPPQNSSLRFVAHISIINTVLTCMIVRSWQWPLPWRKLTLSNLVVFRYWNSSDRARASWAPHWFMPEFSLAWFCESLMQATMTTASP